MNGMSKNRLATFILKNRLHNYYVLEVRVTYLAICDFGYLSCTHNRSIRLLTEVNRVSTIICTIFNICYVLCAMP